LLKAQNGEIMWSSYNYFLSFIAKRQFPSVSINYGKVSKIMDEEGQPWSILNLYSLKRNSEVTNKAHK
jgi:hypothetical protein